MSSDTKPHNTKPVSFNPASPGHEAEGSYLSSYSLVQGSVNRAHATAASKLETKLLRQDQALLLVQEQLLLQVLLERSGFIVSPAEHKEVDPVPAGAPGSATALLVSNLTHAVPLDPDTL